MIRSLKQFLAFSAIVALGIASKMVEPGANRQKKLLSLFNIVQFDNDQCTGTGGTLGTCFTSAECMNRQGIARGSCAAGFGTCCAFQISTCGGVVTQNNTLIQNENFPTGTTTNRVCSFSISNVAGATNICQIRLDFINTALEQPNGMGLCENDMLTVTTTPATVTYPILCGDLSGQHMYIDVVRGSVGAVANVDVQTQTATGARLFNIRTSYIDCNSLSRPPQGCRQYFEGPSARIQSYNFGGLHLQNQQISYCFRQEMGRCSFTVRESTVTGAGDAFELIQGAGEMEMVITCELSCTFCLSAQRSTPFRILFQTIDMDQAMGKGFDLTVTQNPC
eukprot:TCALIF_12361-PA protein Name:"Protein of unknown function" AED:0.08 eAED:0.17 QI:102/0.91/0.92/1/0.16/0.30/13/0/335